MPTAVRFTASAKTIPAASDLDTGCRGNVTILNGPECVSSERVPGRGLRE